MALLGATTLVLAVSAAATGSPAAASRWIVFAASPENGTQPSQLFRIRADGTGLRQLTSGRPASAPSFAPDGKRIAYLRFNAGISVVNLDGTGRHRLTRSSSDAFPVWSPDGKWIAFLRASGSAAPGYRLHVMDASGRRQHLLADAPWPAGRPSWTPDSRALVIPKERGRGAVLYKAAASGGRVLERFPVTIDETSGTAVPTLAPNGRTLVFAGPRPARTGCAGSACELFGLYAAQLPAGKARLLDGARATPAGWAPDSRTLVLAHGYGLQLWPLSGGTSRLLATGTNAVLGDAPPAWQPG
jgi:Tol biopolymer transport system component